MKKRLQNDEFNPFKDAQNFSMVISFFFGPSHQTAHSLMTHLQATKLGLISKVPLLPIKLSSLKV